MNLSSFSMSDRNTGKQICHKFECLFERHFIVYVKIGCYLNDLFAFFLFFFCGILWQTQCLSQPTICLIWRHVLWRYQYLLNLLEKQFESQCKRTEVSKDISIRINYRDTQKSYGSCFFFFFRWISKLILIRPSFGDDTMSQGVHDTEK